MDKTDDTTPDWLDDRELKSLLEDLLSKQNTMTLATAAANEPWAAPVYYVFFKSAFYFFSDPATRHIREAEKAGSVAAAIHQPAAGWRDIRGCQMTGAIQRVAPGWEAVRVVTRYLEKFPFTSELLDGEAPPDLKTMEKRFRVRLYRFRPSRVYYLDNQIRFGFRAEVNL